MDDGRRMEMTTYAAPDAERRRLFRLRRRILALLLATSLVPLVLLAVGSWAVLERVLEHDAEDQLGTIVREHADEIDLFLDERLMALTFAARTHSREQLADGAFLTRAFADLAQSYGDSFLDLGVIDDQGRHLAYVGPYDLLANNYSRAPWFTRVAEQGRYVSDVFLGFRNEPHFVIAVRTDEPDGRFWILRASINPGVFEDLVVSGRTGFTGDCFVVDGAGRYQTSRRGNVRLLDDSGIDATTVPGDGSPDTRIERLSETVRATRRIKGGDWLLVAERDAGEILAPVHRVATRGAAVFALGAMVFLMTATATTFRLVRMIGRSYAERDKARAQFDQASRLASIGEMAVGLAHEINNPLAVIYGEQVNIADTLDESKRTGEDVNEIREALAVSIRYIQRCKSITRRMLQFGRIGVSEARIVVVGDQLCETVRAMAPQARAHGIDLIGEAQRELPPISIDPVELQQVLSNLVTNAIYAAGRGGGIVVSAWEEAGLVHLTIEDTGPGIRDDAIGRVFEPFFTTKPVGQGTGLGLSVCYGIVTRWSGRIEARNASGAGGAVVHVEFPAAQAPDRKTTGQEGENNEREAEPDLRAVGG